MIVFLKLNLDERPESVYYSNLNSDYIVHKKYLNEISKKHDLACKKKLLNENEVKKRMLYYYFLSKCKNKLILYDKYLFFK